jgi:DNA polymerase III subunit beta
MKLTCDREKFLSAFQIAAAVAPLRSPKEILNYIKLDATGETVTLMATDLEAGVRIDVQNVTVERPGKALLPVQKVSNILRENSDEILNLEVGDKSVDITGSNAEFHLPVANPDEYPSVAGFEEDAYFELPARAFRELVRRTVFATDTESTRYALGGVLLEIEDDRITAVATDGRRLASMSAGGRSVNGFKTVGATTIVPAKTLTLLERSLGDLEEPVQIAARNNDILVRTSRCTIYSQLVEGRFPAWRQVVPKREGGVIIESIAGIMASSLRQASIVADPDSRGVDFQFNNGTLILSAATADVGTSRVQMPIAYDGEPVGIMLDARYVGDFFRVLDPDKTFSIDVNSDTEPAVLRTDDEYLYVVMPMARDR